MKIKNFIKKLQSLSEPKKIAIIVVIVAIATLIMGYFWVKSTATNIGKIAESAKSMDLPKIDLQDDSNNFPSVSEMVNSSKGQEVIASLEMADWKTYTNTEYGFEIKYPSDWKIVEDYNKAQQGSDFYFMDSIKENVSYMEIHVSPTSKNDLNNKELLIHNNLTYSIGGSNADESVNTTVKSVTSTFKFTK